MTKSSVSLHQAQTLDSPGGPEAAHEVHPQYLTYRQAQTLTGLSRTTLWKLIGTAGEVKAARVGRTVRIDRRSLEDYMNRAADAQ